METALCRENVLLRRLRKVGWIFAQSTKERDFIMSTQEVCQIAGGLFTRALHNAHPFLLLHVQTSSFHSFLSQPSCMCLHCAPAAAVLHLCL